LNTLSTFSTLKGNNEKLVFSLLSCFEKLPITMKKVNQWTKIAGELEKSKRKVENQRQRSY
jgi:hypothetical protein